MNERDFCRINDLLMRKLRHWLVNDECQWIGDGVNMGLVTQHNSNHGNPQHLGCIPGLSGGKHGKSRR